jgi:hypothetical protein
MHLPELWGGAHIDQVQVSAGTQKLAKFGWGNGGFGWIHNQLQIILTSVGPLWQ